MQNNGLYGYYYEFRALNPGPQTLNAEPSTRVDSKRSLDTSCQPGPNIPSLRMTLTEWFCGLGCGVGVLGFSIWGVGFMVWDLGTED